MSKMIIHKIIYIIKILIEREVKYQKKLIRFNYFVGFRFKSLQNINLPAIVKNFALPHFHFLKEFYFICFIFSQFV